LLPAVRRQAEKFSEFYGIAAQVVGDGDVLVNVRLFEEIMHIVREGLYNVRRHTSAESAIINLRMTDGHLLLEIVNDNAVRGNGAVQFSPRSIVERATELGGRVSVKEGPVGCTAVAVDIPL
jgi:signal transduction histidine kinase